MSAGATSSPGCQVAGSQRETRCHLIPSDKLVPMSDVGCEEGKRVLGIQPQVDVGPTTVLVASGNRGGNNGIGALDEERSARIPIAGAAARPWRRRRLHQETGKWATLETNQAIVRPHPGTSEFEAGRTDLP